MKRTSLIFILLMLAVVSFIASAADVDLFIDCVERVSESGSPRVWLGYSASRGMEVTSTLTGVENDHTGFSPGVLGSPPLTLKPGRHAKVFAVEFPASGYDVTWDLYDETFAVSLTINDQTSGPECDQVGTGEPDGGLDTITVYDVEGEAFTWEVRDVWNHWHAIEGVTTPLQCEDDRCFTRLVLGVGASNDAEDYRVTAVDPPE